MKKNEKLNSKKEIKMFFHKTVISLGYEKQYLDWGSGHFTISEHFYFLFWQVRIMYSIIRF